MRYRWFTTARYANLEYFERIDAFQDPEKNKITNSHGKRRHMVCNQYGNLRKRKMQRTVILLFSAEKKRFEKKCSKNGQCLYQLEEGILI